MRIYLASRWMNQQTLRIIGNHLERLGHTITSQWLDEPLGFELEKAAVRDLADIDRAAALVLWPDEDETHHAKGAYAEFGYALGHGKAVYVIAPETSTCIFMKLPHIKTFPTWDDFYSYIGGP